MAVNTLSFNQLSTVLTSIVNQATGKANLTATNTADFVSVAQTGLQAGYDPLSTAISQVLSRTIFSARPYSRKFKGLEADSLRYGNHVRKLQVADKAWEDDSRITLTDGQSIDQYTVNKPKVLQTNFYGANVYQKSMTIYRDQLDCAFSGPEEFQRFIGMIMGNASDMIEQAHEATARATIANYIAAVVSGSGTLDDGERVVNLVTAYKTYAGISDANWNVYAPANYAPFARWAFGLIKTISQKMQERSLAYHQNPTGYDISRHTPVSDQRAFIYTPEMNTIDATVLSTTFNDEYLKLLPHENVTFWQSFNTPDSINVTPAYMAANGTIATAESAVSQGNIFAVLCDQEAMGYTVVNEWSQPTPFNAKGGYYNQFWHFTDRYWNDFTENFVVFLMA